uniref:Uncharacterized protein n=1 Tax=Clastoptera arizonana TaxID=38151 RepID=A0A1B6C1Z1_9HEMI
MDSVDHSTITVFIKFNEEERDHCRKDALTGMLGWFLQFLLAALAFTCLILKRYCEPKLGRRPWRIWFYDTSKQGLGALFMHMSNIFLSGQFQGDPCTWYIINFLLDSSVGLLLTYIGIRLVQNYAKVKKFNLINFGEYGIPPSTKAWVLQCCLYIILMFLVKILIFLLIRLQFWDRVKDFILSPISNPDLELAVVMLIIPLFVNAMMFWITDNFLMHHQKKQKKIGLLQKMKVHYRHVHHRADSESDIALSTDDELLESTSLDFRSTNIV